MNSAWMSNWFYRHVGPNRPAAPSRPVSKEIGPSRPVSGAARSPRGPEPDAGLKVTTGQTADGLVIRVTGVAGVKQSGALLSGLLAASARRPAVATLDLSELRFLSSLAMGVLVAYRRGVARAGGRVRLAAGLQPAVKEALTRAELLDLFETTEDAGPEPDR
jgi:anti-anti-sigma factor